jgi:chemotaxis methyl-accepting protein methylase
MKHAQPSSVLVLDSDVSEFRSLVERFTGVVLDQPCESLRAILSEHTVLHHLRSATELVALFRSSPTDCEAVLEAVLGDTGKFFRPTEAFEAFQKHVLPELVQRKARQSPSSLRIWSAGCATGEEAYSVALSICESLKDSSAGWNIHIVASDIRRSALKAAERGVYHHSTLEKVPRAWVSSYFSRVGDHFLVKPRLRNLITFSLMNLTEASFFGHFDCVFCMDVLTRFSARQRSALLQRLRMFLEPGGYLFLGDGENIGSDLTLEHTTYQAYSYYRKPLAAAAVSGR